MPDSAVKLRGPGWQPVMLLPLLSDGYGLHHHGNCSAYIRIPDVTVTL